MQKFKRGPPGFSFYRKKNVCAKGGLIMKQRDTMYRFNREMEEEGREYLQVGHINNTDPDKEISEEEYQEFKYNFIKFLTRIKKLINEKDKKESI